MTVVCYELLWRTIVEHRSVHEGAGYFGCGESFRRHCLLHLTEMFGDDEEVLLPTLSIDKLPEDVDEY